jgi:hypothetical protein
MKKLRLVCGLAFAILAAAAVAEAGGKPAGLPPANPPDGLPGLICSILPEGVASWIPFCAD